MPSGCEQRLICASTGAVAALLRAGADGVMWLTAAMLTVEVFARGGGLPATILRTRCRFLI